MGQIETVVDDQNLTARRNVRLLAAAQALAGANSTVIITTGAIVGSVLAPRAGLATLPVSFFVVGTALATLPAGWIARHYGRNSVFTLGTGCGAIVGLVAALAIYLGSFPLFCVATFIGGFYQAVAQTFRFAATDTAIISFRPKALSWVMAGGVFAGVLGPQMVNLTMNMWLPYMFMVSFLVQSVVALVAMAVLAGTHLPKPSAKSHAGGRSLSEISRQPKFIAAVLSGTISYALMNLMMTSAPLAMKMCGLSIESANWGIQWHVVGMYLPSFWTGGFIKRFGAPAIVTTGMMLMACAAFVGLSGITEFHFWTALILLGVGWNFGFVGASAMVVELHRPEESSRVQSFNDFLVFGSMALTSFSSGQILANFGWSYVNYVAFPPIIFAIGTLLLTGAFRKRLAHPITAA